MRVLATWIAAACIAAEGAVEVTKALKGELYNDESVVTDVRVDLGGYATTGGVAAATNAAAAELGGRLADATNAVMGRMEVRVDGATNAVAAELGGRLADATNAAMEAVEGMLGAYATREWLAAQGFARESGLAAYATREWALGQDWATKGWIDSLGLLARGDLAGYATADWVRGQGYATRDEIGEAVQRRFGELAAQTNVSYRLSEEDGTAWLRLYGGDALLTRVDADGTNEAALATMDWTSGYVNESVGAVATEAADGIAGVYASLEAGSVPVAASEVPWDGVKDTPTTLEGYGVAEDATNVVCGIVTNEVHSFGDWVEEWDPPHYGSVYSFSGPDYQGSGHWWGSYHKKLGTGIDISLTAAGGEFATRLVFVGDVGETNFTLTLTRSHATENALGLARMSDLLAHTNRTDNPHKVTAAQVGAYTKEQTDGAISAATDGLASAESVAGLATTNETAAIGRSVNALWQYTFGDRAWIAVTNYMRTAEGVAPSLQLWEVRDGKTNCVYSSGEEIAHVVSNEVGRIALVFSNLLEGVRAQIPATAWSAYQSGSGAPNPASNEVTVVSTPSVMLTGGAEWQQYVDVSSNSLWVLSSRGVTIAGSDTNGYFRIFDAEGKAAFEVVKEKAVTVPAIPQGNPIAPGDVGTMSVTFIANAQPTLFLSPTLSPPAFVEASEDSNASVSWTDNGNGTWTAEVDFVNVYDKYFAYATYMEPGKTVVKNNAPMRVDGGIVTSDGKKIKPVVSGSAVSWEVVE